MERMDFVVVGGGIIGLATALQLLEQLPKARVLLLEKEQSVARHQTGRNSGVIHAGIYYTTGSLKAQFCTQGATMLKAFCQEHEIETQTCGKLIVATEENEIERLNALEMRARANGLNVVRLSEFDARSLEPQIQSREALLSPDTGIVDFNQVVRKLADLFTAKGGEIRLDTRVMSGAESESGLYIETDKGKIACAKAIFCGGLQADRLARDFGADPQFRIIPFRGDYYRIMNQPPQFVSRLIYPVPNPARPFLGVHLTRKLDGSFTVGPSAVLAMSREGYGKADFSAQDLGDSLSWPGFWRLLRQNMGATLDELGSAISVKHYLAKVQRYCPQITRADLAPYRSGIRAQAVGRDGRLIDDFLFEATRHSLHVCNAPSPAATAALPIAQTIVERLLAQDPHFDRSRFEASPTPDLESAP